MSTQAPAYPPGFLDVNHSGRVLGAVSFILVFTTILLALRLYARSLTRASRGWDEYILVPSYLCLLGLLICLYVDVSKGGLGRHSASVAIEDPSKIVTFLKILYILDWFYVPSNAMSRISVVALYLRVFNDRVYRGACWFMIAFLLGNMIVTIIAAQLECFPLNYTWDKSIKGGNCFNQILWYKLTNIPNVVADVMILVLPIPTIWTLHASIHRRAGIAAVFLTGSIGLVASCMRTSVFFTDADLMNADPTYTDEAFSWTAVECGMYFSAACLIGMRPVLSKLPQWIQVRVRNFTNRDESAHGNQTLHKSKIGRHRHYKTLSMSREGDMSTPFSDNTHQLATLESSVTTDAILHTNSSSLGTPDHSLGLERGNIRVESDFEILRE